MTEVMPRTEQIKQGRKSKSCFTESVLTFSLVCWNGSISLKKKKKNRLQTKVCSKVEGTTLTDLPGLYMVRIMKKVPLSPV